ncbi:twinkle mtDNA helicase-like [Mytilus californianus]|uniref:twinkle mtDNA helicase-like n=1 Tax=Mytilus californianus TaxID=6549 RepID=UPI002245B627|nr:twinkle mtDNA helicase-like [Mytilus californianus]
MMNVSYVVLSRLVHTDLRLILRHSKVKLYSTLSFRICHKSSAIRNSLYYACRGLSGISDGGNEQNVPGKDTQDNSEDTKTIGSEKSTEIVGNVKEDIAKTTKGSKITKLLPEKTALPNESDIDLETTKAKRTRPSKKSATDEEKKEKKVKKKKDSLMDLEDFSGLDENVKNLLETHKLKRIVGHTCVIINCLKCSVIKKPVVSDAIYVNKTTGYFTCFTCKKHGPLTALQENFETLIKTKVAKKNFVCFNDKDTYDIYDWTEVDVKALEALGKGEQLKKFKSEEFKQIEELLGFENIQKSTLEKQNITYDRERHALLIPYRSPDGVLIDCKCLTPYFDEDGEFNGLSYSFTNGSGQSSLFGWRKEDEEKKQLILTKTEKDALVLQQTTSDYSVLSLPRESNLPQEVLPYLEKFETVILWFGDDMQSWEYTIKFARKLGERRCLVFRPGDECATPHEILKRNLSISHTLSKAKPMKNDHLTSFEDLRTEVKAQIAQQELVAGVQWRRFVQFNNVLKGLRPGELTVMSGRTGSGKTTFMSEYSLDLCMQGVNTLWGSFEVNNTRLAKTMLIQYAKKKLSPENLNEFDNYADEFQKLPMHFMTFFGQNDIKKVIDTMAHAVYIHDTQHIIVDNLQFMMGSDMDVTDKFSKQNIVYAAFRRFASAHNVHITLVIHPRKENEDTELTTASIFGSAKATQEADNVILLQTSKTKRGGKKYIQVTKNRFDGELGNISLKFDPEDLTLSNAGKKEKKSSGKKISDEKTITEYEDFSDEYEEEEKQKEFIM